MMWAYRFKIQIINKAINFAFFVLKYKRGVVMKKEKSCGAVVIKKDEGGINFLIIKQHDENWHFPKGHVEDGETERETAIREVKEETGLDVEVDTNYRYTTNYSPKPGVSKDVIFFLGKVVGGEIKPQVEEVSEVKFVPIDEALDMIHFDDMKEIYRNVLKDIKKD